MGALLTGVLAEKAWNGGAAAGALFGEPRRLLVQAVGVAAAIAFSAAGTFAILRLVGLFAPLRAGVREEGLGLDVTQHGEEGYTRGEGAILVLPDPTPVSGLALPVVTEAAPGSR